MDAAVALGVDGDGRFSDRSSENNLIDGIREAGPPSVQ